MPGHHNLEPILTLYRGSRDAMGARFPFGLGRWPHRQADGKPMHCIDEDGPAPRTDLGTRSKIGCHTFLATGITAYLEAGGTLEDAQAYPTRRAPPSFTTGLATRSRSMRWSGLTSRGVRPGV